MVAPIIAATAISAGSSLVGGLFGRSSAKKSRKQQQRQFQQNIALQKEFAQKGIRWKVADAKAAGLHPLSVVGGGAPSFSPVSTAFAADNSLGEGLAAAGQDISRGIMAKQTADERLAGPMHELQIQRMQLENQNLVLQNRNLQNQSQLPPPMPTASSPADGQVETVPAQQISRALGQPSSEAGSHPENRWVQKANGAFMAIPGEIMTEGIEENELGSIIWQIENGILPHFNIESPPPKSLLPKGALGWRFENTKNGYVPRYPYPNRKLRESNYLVNWPWLKIRKK